MNPGSHKKDPYYKSLTRKMILTVIIVSFTPMILVSGAILYQFHVSYHEKVAAHLEELVQKHKQNIDYFLDEKLGDIRFVAQCPQCENLNQESFLEQQLATLQQELDPVFVDLGLVNAKGRQIAYAGPFKLGEAQYSEAEWFKKAIQSQYFISDVFLGLRGLPHFIVAVRKRFNGKTWILRATIDFMAFNNLVENVRIGKTGFAFILNRQGEFQTRLSRDVMPSKSTYMELLKNGGKGQEKIYIVEAVDDYGKKNIYTSAFLKNGDWMLVCQQNKSDAYSDLYRAKKIAGLIFLLGGLGIITMAFLLSRRMVSHIALADREKDMMNQQVIETGKLATVGELAAGIAHEINNPVAIMVEEAGWMEDLLEDEEFKESENLDEFERALKQINTQGKRCKEITHKLLSFARKTDSRIQVVLMNDLVNDAIGLAEQSARYSKIVINKNLEENLPFIQASQTEIQQVFLNLINNAVDAMDKKNGGVIDITSRLDGNTIVVDFADNGPGIPRDNLARIFDPFFTTKQVGKGTGLGLSICYGIIKKMGGEINVKSVVDKGTTFSIRIPVPKELLEETSTV
ncbi:MAG: ATP-binding protein [Thermodesulfobacteriota bacterium]|nr:ATP-binding protein [Thermodesulfobacteriota bacterium]